MSEIEMKSKTRLWTYILLLLSVFIIYFQICTPLLIMQMIFCSSGISFLIFMVLGIWNAFRKHPKQRNPKQMVKFGIIIILIASSSLVLTSLICRPYEREASFTINGPEEYRGRVDAFLSTFDYENTLRNDETGKTVKEEYGEYYCNATITRDLNEFNHWKLKPILTTTFLSHGITYMNYSAIMVNYTARVDEYRSFLNITNESNIDYYVQNSWINESIYVPSDPSKWEQEFFNVIFITIGYSYYKPYGGDIYFVFAILDYNGNTIFVTSRISSFS